MKGDSLTYEKYAGNFIANTATGRGWAQNDEQITKLAVHPRAPYSRRFENLTVPREIEG
jgi:hypothetical protein